MQKIEVEIQKRLNRQFFYGSRVITLTGYSIDTERGRVYIHTNEKPEHFDRTIEDAPYFLSTLKPADQLQAAAQDPVMSMDLSAADYLEDVLKESIQKLQKDAGYIKQATAITNNVNSLISITKLKLDYVKLMSRSKRK